MSETAEKLARLSVPALDEILGVKLPVLNDGFVRVVDYMGSDDAIVQAARISYGSGTKMVSEDRGLIRYLMRHWHTTPFEMCELKLHVRVPMDIWRQWIRHRMANVNEYSTRYSIAIDAAELTKPGEWRMQSADNKQGSAGYFEAGAGSSLTARERELHELAKAVYNERLERGVAREQARKDLPLSTYTEAYWKIDLHNLLHFLRLRMHDHAQYEIRCYAKTIGEEIVRRWCPMAWEAFVDYRFEAQQFSRLEAEIIKAALTDGPEAAKQKAEALGLVSYGEKGLKRNRERAELEEKLAALGVPIPWR